jgi:hypothetical protein
MYKKRRDEGPWGGTAAEEARKRTKKRSWFFKLNAVRGEARREGLDSAKRYGRRNAMAE